MAFLSGNGGEVIVGAVTLHVAKWEGNFGARLVENTNSNTSGATSYDKVVDDASWTIEIPLDDTNLPDTDAGLTGGTKVTIKFYLGAGAKFYQLTNTTVEEIRPSNDNAQDIVRVTVTGKGGAITLPVT